MPCFRKDGCVEQNASPSQGQCSGGHLLDPGFHFTDDFVPSSVHRCHGVLEKGDTEDDHSLRRIPSYGKWDVGQKSSTDSHANGFCLVDITSRCLAKSFELMKKLDARIEILKADPAKKQFLDKAVAKDKLCWCHFV